MSELGKNRSLIASPASSASWLSYSPLDGLLFPVWPSCVIIIDSKKEMTVTQRKGEYQ